MTEWSRWEIEFLALWFMGCCFLVSLSIFYTIVRDLRALSKMDESERQARLSQNGEE